MITPCSYLEMLTREIKQQKIQNLKEPQTISTFWFYLLHNYVVMSTKSK